MDTEKSLYPETIIINEAPLLLAEKRTPLTAMHTGIAVFALPITVISVLIATSKYYDIVHVIHLPVPLLIFCAALVLVGSYLIIRSIKRTHHHNSYLSGGEHEHHIISEFIN